MLTQVLILSFISGAYLSDITAKGDASVAFGDDASLSCSLPRAPGIKQVTWQRVLEGDGVKTVATFSEQFKHHVDSQFVGRVNFTASLNSTSIVIKNTTFEDEACYICSFKAYPAGTKRETMCITVKGISELTAAVNPEPSSDSDVVVSCSATGKPTPTIQWKSDGQELDFFISENFTTHNKDRSTTVTSNLTLPLSQFHGKYVECLAESDGTKRREQISIPRQHHEVNSITSRNYIITVSVFTVMTVVVIIIIVICFHTKLKRAAFGKKRLRNAEDSAAINVL